MKHDWYKYTYIQSQGHNNIQSRLNMIWVFNQKMCHIKHKVKEKRIYVCLLLFIKKKESYTKNERIEQENYIYTLFSSLLSSYTYTVVLLLSLSLSFSLFFNILAMSEEDKPREEKQKWCTVSLSCSIDFRW